MRVLPALSPVPPSGGNPALLVPDLMNRTSSVLKVRYSPIGLKRFLRLETFLLLFPRLQASLLLAGACGEGAGDGRGSGLS